MGWSVGFDPNWRRDIGYGVPATCDYPGCAERIDRGLSYVCGGQPYGGDDGCGLYFCAYHMAALGPPRCVRCADGDDPFDPTPDVVEWIEHKATHPSWAAWRDEIVQAQHDETGRMWEGRRCDIPARYAEVG